MNKAWFIVCVDSATPDGPGQILGPFPTRDLCLGDLEYQKDLGACENEHLLVFGPGPAEASESLFLHGSPQAMEARDYYQNHPDEIPEACKSYILT